MNTFADYNEVPDWAKKDVEQAIERGIIKAFENGFLEPETLMTRIEGVVLANRVYTKLYEELHK